MWLSRLFQYMLAAVVGKYKKKTQKAGGKQQSQRNKTHRRRLVEHNARAGEKEAKDRETGNNYLLQ